MFVGSLISNRDGSPVLDTDQLRSFLAIVDTGSFTRAAQRVNKTQSAVSMQMKRLEEQLGRDLFVKKGRGTRLSDDGDRLVDFARQMLKLEAAALVAVAGKGLTGRLRIGMPDDYAEAVLPRIVKPFSRLHPLVDISVVCANSAALALAQDILQDECRDRAHESQRLAKYRDAVAPGIARR